MDPHFKTRDMSTAWQKSAREKFLLLVAGK